MPESEAKRHIRIYDAAKAERAMLNDYFQDLMYYSLPRKAYINKIKIMGDRYPTDIYDSTAIMANAYFAAGMQAYMSSPQTKWFGIGIEDKNLMSKKSVQTYIHDTEDVLYAMLNSSNFYQEDVEGYLNHGSIGSDLLYGEDDLLEDVRFTSIPIENAIVIVDAKGRLSAVYIEYEYTCEQAIEKFGKNKVGEKVLKAFNDNDFTAKFKYIFCVYKRAVFNPAKRDAVNMPIGADWVERDREVTIKVGGFKDMPFFFSRFMKSKNSPYGDSVMMNILPDVQMLNQIEYTNILGAQMTIKPPFEIPDECFMKPYNFNPGGKNIKLAGYPNEHITPINAGVNLKIGIEYVQYKKQAIQQAFYNDLFLSLERIGDMTATEVQIRNNQRMQLLGSAIGNIMREKLSPVIERIYSIAARKNKLPPLPPELKDKDYVIEYISPLARAQKSLEMNNISQAMAIIGQFAELQLASGQMNTVIDKLDLDKATDNIADITNLAPRIIRDDAEVDALREARIEEALANQQMMQLQQGVDIAKTGAEADKAAQGVQ